MTDLILSRRNQVGTVVGRRPTTLSARAAELLSSGPMDALSLMRVVCQVDRLQADAADRMAVALLASHDEFVQNASGYWELRQTTLALGDGPAFTDQADEPPLGLSAVSFAVVDVETTGTRSSDRVTEVAIARVHGGAIVDVFSQLVNPERPIPSHISALTHITWDMVKDEPPFRRIAEDVAARLAGHVFTAHNAAFDWRFIGAELGRTGARLSGPRLCTVRLAKVLVPQLSRRSLDNVAHYFGINISRRHRAAGDAEATAHALVRMLRIAEDEGLSTWPQLDGRLKRPARRSARGAVARRQRAFPLPVMEDTTA